MERVAGALPGAPTLTSTLLGLWTVAAAGAIGFFFAEAYSIALVLAALASIPLLWVITPIQWIIAALAVGILFRALTTAGLLPGAAPFLHYPLVAIGLTVAAARTDADWRRARLPVGGLAVLGTVAVGSTLIAGLELVRAAFMAALLLEPLALVAAMALARPDEGECRLLSGALVTLVLIQVPIALAQLAGIDIVTVEDRVLQDRVEGTLAGSDAAAHHLGAIGAVVGIWGFFAFGGAPRWGMALTAVAIPAISAAKQVLIGIPPAAIAALLVGGKGRWRMYGLVASFVAFALAIPVLLSGYAGRQLDSFLAGTGGKAAAIERVTGDGSKDQLIGLIGSGPASSVSASAWLTTDELREGDSPLSALDLAPAQTAIDLGALSGQGGSIDSPRSSAIGVAGDLGLLGLAAYVGVWALIGAAIVVRGGVHAPGGIAALVIAAPLGVISDFWEIPPFPLIAGVIIGLAYAAPREGATQ